MPPGRAGCQDSVPVTVAVTGVAESSKLECESGRLRAAMGPGPGVRRSRSGDCPVPGSRFHASASRPPGRSGTEAQWASAAAAAAVLKIMMTTVTVTAAGPGP